MAPVQVNKGIYATIMTEPGMFFAYNNEMNGIHQLQGPEAQNPSLQLFSSST